jgi:hypothetical protein
VAGNVFTLTRDDGGPLGTLRYALADGRTVTVDPTTPD